MWDNGQQRRGGDSHGGRCHVCDVRSDPSSALWAIGPLEDGDFDPAGYGGTIAGAFVAITMVVAFMVLYLLRMRPKICTRS